MRDEYTNPGCTTAMVLRFARPRELELYMPEGILDDYIIFDETILLARQDPATNRKFRPGVDDNCWIAVVVLTEFSDVGLAYIELAGIKYGELRMATRHENG